MLPATHSESIQEASQRQANYILLRYLESAVNKDLFDKVLSEVSSKLEFPKRIDWTGTPQNLSFDELKINFSHIDQSAWQAVSCSHNMSLMVRQRKMGILGVDQKMFLKKQEISRFERMKTIFGHALPDEQLLTSIYSVSFDQEGQFVISGADDGIIKIWDKETLQIQASLHGHEDVITDIDISKCNKYIASASKDGRVIIWDLKKGCQVDRFICHNGSVNNIKFFRHKPKKDSSGNRNQQIEDIEILVTCSDDGSINIYDEHGYLQNLQLNSQDVIARRSRRQDVGIRRERFFLHLTPEDYRPGSRNKKIESVTLNQSGLIAAGTNTGDIFMWQIDFNQFKKQVGKIATWLGAFRKHTKDVHFCDFSPTGKLLFTGSVDGTAKVWNVEQDKQHSTDSTGAKQLFQLSQDRLKVTLEETRSYENFLVYKAQSQIQINDYKSNCQCDCLTWSAYGRYAIASISGKIVEQQIDASSIKIWDSYTGKVIQDLTEGQNIQLKNFSLVLAPHPKVEEYLMSGSDGGLIILWNIKTREIIKKFTEYGVYSQDRYTISTPFDGKFSKDGSCFVVGSISGTISIYSNDNVKHQYDATRVEQFYHLDNTKHGTNVYEELEENEVPQVCAFNMIPYEVQPPKPLIGKFKQNLKPRTIENNILYERNYITRQTMGLEEEDFIQNLLEEGLRQNMFIQEDQNINEINSENMDLDMADEDDLDIPQRRGVRPRLQSHNSIGDHANNEQIGQQNIDARRALQAAQVQNQNRNRRGRPGRPRVQEGQRRQAEQENELIRLQALRRNNPNYDPENSLYDRDSDTNFEIEDDDEDDEDLSFSVSQQSYIEKADKFKRENYHSQQQNRVEERKRSQLEYYYQQKEEEKKKQEQGRNERAKRRQQRLNAGLEDDEEEEEKILVRGRKNGRRRALSSSEEEVQDKEESENEYGISDLEPKITKKRLIKQNRKERNKKSSASDDAQSDEGNKLNNTKTIFNEDEFVDEEENLPKKNKKEGRSSTERKKITSNTRSGRRKERVRYDNMDDSSDEVVEQQIKEDQNKNSHLLSADKYELINTNKSSFQQEQSEEEEDNDEAYIDDMTAYDKSKVGKGDEDYELVPITNKGNVQLEENMIENQGQERKCAFCLRVDTPLVGPFIKFNLKKIPIDGPHYFHKDCIEVNNYSFFNKQKSKWLNIGKAMDLLVKKKSYSCRRCSGIGATIKCSTCHQWYHGYLCSSLYMIWLGKQEYECFECRNSNNHYKFKEKPPKIDDQENENIRKLIPRDHLLSFKRDLVSNFMPQINDKVYYFFQGHEKFISSYNCFFYAGDQEQLTFQYPWIEIPELQQPMLCQIINMSFHYPSRNSLALIRQFGKGSSQVVQTPQIIIQLDVQILDMEDKVFQVGFFPNDLPDFFVLKDVFEKSMTKFEILMQQDLLKGKVFKTKCKNFRDVKVVDIKPKEPTMFPFTNWETVLFLHQEYQGLRDRGRRAQPHDSDPDLEMMAELINFWELLLTQDAEEEENYQLSAFEEDEQERLANIVRDFKPNRKDNIELFRKRVTEDQAPDYRSHVAADMYLELIELRLRNSYYRSQNQLFFDLDLISYNSTLFNGDTNPITQQAKRIVEQIRVQLKLNINTVGDKKIKKGIRREGGLIQQNFAQVDDVYQKPAGKLTAPTRFVLSTDNNTITIPQSSSMDQFLQDQKKQQIIQQQQQFPPQVPIVIPYLQNSPDNQTLIRIPRSDLYEEVKVHTNQNVGLIRQNIRNGKRTQQQRNNYSYNDESEEDEEEEDYEEGLEQTNQQDEDENQSSLIDAANEYNDFKEDVEQNEPYQKGQIPIQIFQNNSISGSGSRKSTRNQVKINYNENILEKGGDLIVKEKHLNKNAESKLGKRQKRSFKQVPPQINGTTNEIAHDNAIISGEFNGQAQYEMLLQAANDQSDLPAYQSNQNGSNMITIVPVVSNSRYPKRTRNN